jgi:hypothetical protein
VRRRTRVAVTSFIAFLLAYAVDGNAQSQGAAAPSGRGRGMAGADVSIKTDIPAGVACHALWRW